MYDGVALALIAALLQAGLLLDSFCLLALCQVVCIIVLLVDKETEAGHEYTKHNLRS